MTIIDRGQVTAPVLRKKTVLVEALGGEVVVRGLLLKEILERRNINADVSAPREGETEERARSRAGGQIVAYTLACSVLLSDGQPLFTEAEWEVFGANNPGDVLALFQATKELNGQDATAVAKN